MTKLRHPNIVLLLGVVMSPRPAIVQEFCIRGSLYSVLQRHTKSGAPELTWRIRLQMALERRRACSICMNRPERVTSRPQERQSHGRSVLSSQGG